MNTISVLKEASNAYKEKIQSLARNIVYSFPKDSGRKVLFCAADKFADADITGANTALCLAAAGHKVLLIDCNFQDSKVTSRLLPEGCERGFSDVMCGLCKPADAVYKAQGLDFIGLGKFSPNSQKLLNSEKIERIFLELFNLYDFIIFCSSPANTSSGAPAFAAMCDGVLLVVRERKSRMIDIRRSGDNIRFAGGYILGIVIENSRSKV